MGYGYYKIPRPGQPEGKTMPRGYGVMCKCINRAATARLIVVLRICATAALGISVKNTWFAARQPMSVLPGKVRKYVHIAQRKSKAPTDKAVPRG